MPTRRAPTRIATHACWGGAAAKPHRPRVQRRVVEAVPSPNDARAASRASMPTRLHGDSRALSFFLFDSYSNLGLGYADARARVGGATRMVWVAQIIQSDGRRPPCRAGRGAAPGVSASKTDQENRLAGAQLQLDESTLRTRACVRPAAFQHNPTTHRPAHQDLNPLDTPPRPHVCGRAVQGGIVAVVACPPAAWGRRRAAPRGGLIDPPQAERRWKGGLLT